MKPTPMKTLFIATSNRRAPGLGGSGRHRSVRGAWSLSALACLAALAAWDASPALADNDPKADQPLKLQPLEDILDGAAVPMGTDETIFSRIQLDKLVKRADWIVHGDVASSEARWVRGNIETSYRVNVRESLKGDGPASFDLTLTGGKAPNGAPVSQYVVGSAQMSEGEEVVLFLRKDFGAKLDAVNSKREQAGLAPMEFSSASRAAFSPRLVGKQKGKFTVLTLDSGQKALTRLRPAPMILDSETSSLMADAAKRRAEKLYSPDGPVEELLKAPKADPLEFAGQAGIEGEVRVPSRDEALTYSPSLHTDPKAPQLQPNQAKARRPFVPFNADAMSRPVLLDDFKKEVARLSGQQPKAPAQAAEQE